MAKVYGLLYAGYLLLVGITVEANECLSHLPAKLVPLGDVKHCISSFTGLPQYYSCQDYHHQAQRYRVIYKGGLTPRALIKLNPAGNEQLLWSPRFGDDKMHCPLPAPDGVPQHAVHHGLGICQDEAGTDVPCSVYEHVPIRQTKVYRYLVFYRADGAGVTQIDKLVAGENRNAMVAEIAYQLGLSLLQTTCCNEKALFYLEHAHRLFPRASAYRLGYLQALEQQMAANEK